MTIKVNQKYRLSKEYINFLSIKPQSELIEIKMIYADTVVYTDGISTFTDRVVNIIPNLISVDFQINVHETAKAIAPKKDDTPKPTVTPSIKPADTTPKITDPVVVEPQKEETKPQNNESTPATPQDNKVNSNPYDDNYL